jgi:predicted PurR-regulated permease PerM
MEEKNSQRIELPYYLRITIILLALVLTVLIMRTAKSVLVPILVAGFLAILISPFTAWLERKKIPPTLSATISLLSILLLVAGVIYFFYTQIANFSNDLGGLEIRFSELLGSLSRYLGKFSGGRITLSAEIIKDALFNQVNENLNVLTKGVIATVGTLTLVFIIPIYLFLFIFYRRFIIAFIKKTFAKKHEEKIEHTVIKVKNVVQKYIKGAFYVICILAVLNSIALFSLGIKHALLFAVFAAILNVIPFLGPIIGSILPILFALLTKDSLWYPFGVFLSFYIIQVVESNFFTPRIVGNQVSMNPLMTIIALFIGNFIWGLAGMILFIPGMAILKVIFDQVEGMEPYGFLLGSVQSKKKFAIIEGEKIVAKFKKKKKHPDDDNK